MSIAFHEYTMKPGSQGKSVVFYAGLTTATTDIPRTAIGQTANTFDDWDTGAGKSTYYREGAAAVVAINAVTKALGVWTSGGILLLSDALMPGCYVLDVPNAALARGAGWVIISLLENDDAQAAQVLIKINLIRSLATG